MAPIRRILIVDDSEIMRRLVRISITHIPDISIEEAGDGVAALSKLGAGNWDLVIADIQMPLMDGLKLVHFIRSDERLSAIPVIIITSDDREEDLDRATRLGVQGFLKKPVMGRDVVELVEQLLSSPGL